MLSKEAATSLRVVVSKTSVVDTVAPFTVVDGSVAAFRAFLDFFDLTGLSIFNLDGLSNFPSRSQ